MPPLGSLVQWKGLLLYRMRQVRAVEGGNGAREAVSDGCYNVLSQTPAGCFKTPWLSLVPKNFPTCGFLPVKSCKNTVHVFAKIRSKAPSGFFGIPHVEGSLHTLFILVLEIRPSILSSSTISAFLQ